MTLPLGHHHGASRPVLSARWSLRGRWFVLLLGATASLVALSCAREPNRPSVIFVLVDTLRHDYLGCYGFEGPISPNLDRLSRSSHLFERAYAQAPWTKPSIASLFTGIYPTGHGVVNHEGLMGRTDYDTITKGRLAGAAVTLAEVYRDHGFATSAVVGNPWVTRDYGFDQGFTHFDDSLAGVSTPAGSLLALAEDWLHQRDKDVPYLLYVHLMDVHGPYLAPEEDYRAVSGSASLDKHVLLTTEEMDRIPRHLRKGNWVKSRDLVSVLGEWQARYAAGVHHVDRELGGFVDRLEAAGILDEAILVVTSDHGEEFHEHGGWTHGDDLFEHQIHVPLMIRPPGGLDESRRHDGLIRLIDVMPSLLAMTGVETPTGLDGQDLSPRTSGGVWGHAPLTFACATTRDPALAAMNVGTYKVIMNTRVDSVAVFDVIVDPREQRDVALVYPRLTRELTSYLRSFFESQASRHLFEDPTNPISEDRMRQLKAIGYLN